MSAADDAAARKPMTSAAPCAASAGLEPSTWIGVKANAAPPVRVPWWSPP